MATRTRHLLIAAMALVISSGLGWSGAFRFAWQRLAGLFSPWQRAMVAAEGQPTPAQRLAAAEEQVIQLNAENVLLRTRLGEYLAIRGEGGLPPEQVVVVRARIIGRTQRLGRRYLELDAGAVDGVAKGMAVCCGWSLVGLVAGVQEGRCLVQQLTDAESRVPAALFNGEKMLAEGVVTGTGKRGQLLLDFVEDREGIDVAPGQHVVTAGSDARLPAGLVIGTVTSATRSSTADHWHIEVAPLRIAEAAESLLVLKFSGPDRH
jgi:rod shape-determining protein MreC